jgi:hypothetical protein
MQEEKVTPGALAHLHAGGFSKLLASKKLKKRARKNSRTDRFSLQERRDAYAGYQEVLDYEVKLLESGAVKKEDEQARLLTHANLIGIQIMTAQLGLVVDSLTEAFVFPKVKQKDGSIKPQKLRISIAETMSELHDMHVDLGDTVRMLADIAHTMGKAQNLWFDEKTGVQRSPYEDRPEDIERKKKEEVLDDQVTENDESEDIDSDKIDDLRRMSSEFIRTGKVTLKRNEEAEVEDITP